MPVPNGKAVVRLSTTKCPSVKGQFPSGRGSLYTSTPTTRIAYSKCPGLSPESGMVGTPSSSCRLSSTTPCPSTRGMW